MKHAVRIGLTAWLASAWLLVVGAAHGAEPSLPAQATVSLEDQPIQEPPALDGQHRRVSGMIEDLLRRTDALFGGDRLYDAPTGSYLQLGARGTLWPERYADTDVTAITRAKINLPRTQERLKLLFDRDLEDVTKPPTQRDAEVAAGVTQPDNNPY